MLRNELYKQVAKPGTTAIIVTGQLPVRFFALSLISLIQHSSIRQIIVYINGEAEDHTTQDSKQAFCTELRRSGIGVEIKIMRIWGALGHAHCLQGAIPWVATENILSIHDDTLIMKADWQESVEELLRQPETGLVVHTPLYMLPYCHVATLNEKVYFSNAHCNSSFIAWNKSRLLHLDWVGYHAEYEDRIVAYDIGSLLLLEMAPLRVEAVSDIIFHFGAGSWGRAHPAIPVGHLLSRLECLYAAEEELMKSLSPQLLSLYRPLRIQKFQSSD